MPSVPKYLPAMSPDPLERVPNDRSIQSLKSSTNNEGRLEAEPQHSGTPNAALPCYRFFLSPTVGGGWVTLIGSEAGKLSSRPCSRDRSSLRLCASSCSCLE